MKVLFYKGFSFRYALVTTYYTYPEPTPTSSPPSLSDGGLPQKAFQSQSLNRAKTPYPGYVLASFVVAGLAGLTQAQ